MLHLSATREAGEATQLYFWIRNLAAPLALVGVALREVRYGEGDARSPMVATIVGNAVNIALATTVRLRPRMGRRRRGVRRR